MASADQDRTRISTPAPRTSADRETSRSTTPAVDARGWRADEVHGRPLTPFQYVNLCKMSVQRGIVQVVPRLVFCPGHTMSPSHPLFLLMYSQYNINTVGWHCRQARAALCTVSIFPCASSVDTELTLYRTLLLRETAIVEALVPVNVCSNLRGNSVR